MAPIHVIDYILVHEFCHLVYMNHFMDDNYDTLNGLRLVGKEERPWFEVDGSIYSRYDLDKYVQTFANQDSVGQFLTTTGLSEELSYALTEVSDEGILQFLQYNAENNSIKTTVGQKGNIVDSKYTFGLYESHLLTTVTGGTSELLLTGADGVSISIKSDFAPENTIFIKTAENISNSFLSNLEYGFNIVALYNESKIEAYNDNEHGYYLKGNYKNNAIIESSIEEQQFSFSGIVNNDAYLKQLVNIEETSLKLKSTAGTWSYIELHDSQKHWNIGVTTAIEGATANLQPSSLQFRKDNSDTKKITFNYDDNIYVKENIIILYSVFSILFNKVKDNLKKIIKDNNIFELNPALKIQENYSISDNLTLFNNIKIKNNIVKNYTINSTLYNFYANDNISNASQIMSNCNKSLVKRSNY